MFTMSTMLPFLAFILSVLVNVKSQTSTGPPICNSQLLLDLVIILDSSGSVYDSGYNNWQAELDFAKGIVNSSLPSQSRVSLINFSGCGSSYTFESCKDYGRLKKMFGFTDYGTPNNQQALYDRIDAMSPSDFNGGTTWTNEALTIALNEFKANSSADRTKMIVLVTDGQPYPTGATPPHEPCSASYMSNELQELIALDVTILVVAVGSFDETDELFLCIVQDVDSHFFVVNDFYNLEATGNSIHWLICPPTLAPTIYPTKPPTIYPTTVNPTASPTNNPIPSPTTNPTLSPTKGPTYDPTRSPTNPTVDPTVYLTKAGASNWECETAYSGPEANGMTLQSWYYVGSGEWGVCEDKCEADPQCNSWMGRNSGNTCYLSTDSTLRAANGCCSDHHPRIFYRHSGRELCFYSGPDENANGMTLQSWYYVGSGEGNVCEDKCVVDARCKSWMVRNSGNTCYLSEDSTLKAANGCCTDHHPHIFYPDWC